MTDRMQLDSLILGRQLRHHRKRAGLTLDDLGAMVGKPAPYLSLLENGRKEPRLALVMSIASAVGVEISDLLAPDLTTRRDTMEVALLRAQETSLFESLDLPRVKPTARMNDDTLGHLVGLHAALREKSTIDAAGSEDVRRANGAVHQWLRQANGLIEDVESAAHDALTASGYTGDGPFSSHNLIDLSDHMGFEISPIEDMPNFARSIVDMKNRRVYIAQRDELTTRQARKAVLQTLAEFVLAHEMDPDIDTFMLQRTESAYFATAVLVPRASVVPRLERARLDHDLAVEDVEEAFNVSHEMAAWRMANLVTQEFGMRSHLLVSNDLGAVIKGYENDGLPVTRDSHGGMETQRLCRRWASRAPFDSGDRYRVHHQYTDTSSGTYFCSTYVEPDRTPEHAITFGVPFAEARWFRGRDTETRETSTCPDPACCRLPEPDLAANWEGSVMVSARSQLRILGLMASDPYPALDMPEVLAVVERHSTD